MTDSVSRVTQVGLLHTFDAAIHIQRIGQLIVCICLAPDAGGAARRRIGVGTRLHDFAVVAV